MKNVNKDDFIKLPEALKNVAKTYYDYAKVTTITLNHPLGSYLVEATLQDKPSVGNKIHKLVSSQCIGTTFSFKLNDICF